MQTRLELDQLFHPVPSLETERLYLEPLVPSHAGALFEVYSSAEVMRFGDDAPHKDVDATRTHIGGMIKRREARTAISWTLVSKAESRPVGVCTIHTISWFCRRADLGFELAPRLWRQGLMSEALLSVAAFCFDTLRFIKLVAQNTTDNDPCHALLLRLGFQQEGLLRSHGFWKGQAQDVRTYGLLAPVTDQPA